MRHYGHATGRESRLCGGMGENMKKYCQKFAGYLLFTALAAAVLAGCGSSGGEKYEASADTATYAAAGQAFDGGIYENAAPAEAPAAEEIEYEEEGGAETVRQENRKLIKTVDMNVETEEFDLLLRNVEQKVEELGGYLEQSNVYNGSYTSNYRSRSADLTARVPSAKLDQFVTDVAEHSNVTRKNESVEDITLQYVDLESHKKALLAEQQSLLTMLEQAESIEDIITINAQLTDVRYQLESMESQLRTYDNKVDYSTVYLNIEEVEQYEPYAAKSTGERIRDGFTRNLHRVGDGVSNFFIELIISLPILFTLAVLIGIFVLLLFGILKASEKQAKKRREKKERENPGQYNRYGMRIPGAPRQQSHAGQGLSAGQADRLIQENQRPDHSENGQQ